MYTWETISKFHGMVDFENFTSWIQNQVQEKYCEEITVKSRYDNN